jgi:hypothetical protein
MTPRELIYHLLDQVLLETRLEGERTANALFFQVADLLEHTPIDLARALQGNGACEEILVQLRDRARQRGYDRWLDRATADYRRHQGHLTSAGPPSEAQPDSRPHDCRERLHAFLSLALLDIRVEAHERQNERIWGLAHLFHNVPAELERTLRGERDDDDLLAGLRSNAQRMGYGMWLERAIAGVMTSPISRSGAA